MEPLATAVLDRVQEFGPQEVSNVSWALAVETIQNRRLREELAMGVNRCMHEFKRKDGELNSQLEGLAKSAMEVEKWSRLVEESATTAMAPVLAQQVGATSSFVLFAMVKAMRSCVIVSNALSAKGLDAESPRAARKLHKCWAEVRKKLKRRQLLRLRLIQ
eukprot:g120.t1